MIYLASPYSHPDSAVREQRFALTRNYVAAQLALGNALFSPIVYGHQFAELYGFRGDAAAWQPINDEWLRASSRVWVLRLPGWDTSVGVHKEIAQALELDLLVQYKDMAL